MQDSVNTIKMGKNDLNSCTGNSRHINIRYLFFKNRVDKTDIEIVHCPTEVILANYFLKSLQGMIFCIFIEVIMGWKYISTLNQIYVRSKERVGECIDGSKYSKKTYVEALTIGMS